MVKIKFKYLFSLLPILIVLSFFGCSKRSNKDSLNQKQSLTLPKKMNYKPKSTSEKYRLALFQLAKNPKNIPLQYEIAGYCEELEKYEEAASRYKYVHTFSTKNIYLNNETISLGDLARYKEIACEKKNAFNKNINCDVNPLEKVIRISSSYLKNGYEYKKEKVATIYDDSRSRLLEKKEILHSQYLAKGNVVAATTVLKNIQEMFSDVKDIEARCKYLECCTLIQQGQIEDAKLVVNDLKTKYAESAFTKRAFERISFFFQAKGAIQNLLNL